MFVDIIIVKLSSRKQLQFVVTVNWNEYLLDNDVYIYKGNVLTLLVKQFYDFYLFLKKLNDDLQALLNFNNTNSDTVSKIWIFETKSYVKSVSI